MNFQATNIFFYVSLCLDLQSRDLGSPKLAHLTLSLILLLSLHFNLLGFIAC